LLAASEHRWYGGDQDTAAAAKLEVQASVTWLLAGETGGQLNFNPPEYTSILAVYNIFGFFLV
jgi:hypothetical protein